MEGYYESYIAAAAILDLLATWTGPAIDAVVWAGFDGTAYLQGLLQATAACLGRSPLPAVVADAQWALCGPSAGARAA